MIEKIEFSVEGQNHTFFCTREEFLTHLENTERGYFNTYRVKTWINDGKIVTPPFKGGLPSYFWDSIVKIFDTKTIIIYNSDTTVRYTIPIPEELIQWEEFQKHFGNDKFFKRSEYIMSFESFNSYFEFENKFYCIILIALEQKNEPFNAYLQERYLDTDNGTLLPFTKRIIRRVPNQYSYNEKTVIVE